MSHEAYRRTAARTASPREAEYRAFAEATRRLIAAAERGRADLEALAGAVHFNRALWGALAADCADDKNGLPTETRAGVIALSRWVARHSSDVMRARESVEPLIDVNRLIMEGLSGRSAA
ncbi:MAG: flagellar biosynthesis regulator FlaF [Amphiplicatus sp.]